MKQLPDGCVDHFRAFTGAVSLKLAAGCKREVIRSNFRAFTGAVSLKQALADAGDALDVDFRAFTGAVSLKQFISNDSHKVMLVLPRLHRRGLIEAVADLPCDIRWRLLPRLHRRGLIEAIGIQRHRHEGKAHFRAFTGAVSLKRHNEPTLPTEGADFRAFTGAVSLKLQMLGGARRVAGSTSAPSQARSH